MFCDVEEVTCNALLAVCECNLQCVCTSIRSVSNTCACMLYAYFSCVCVCVCEGGGGGKGEYFLSLTVDFVDQPWSTDMSSVQTFCSIS